jgi:hypothetical protein
VLLRDGWKVLVSGAPASLRKSSVTSADVKNLLQSKFPWQLWGDRVPEQSVALSHQKQASLLS